MKTNNSKLKEKLIDTATRLFAERGRDRVSLRDIATEAGATHGSIRHHFGTKENLYLEAIMRIEPMDLPDQGLLQSTPKSPEEAVEQLRAFVKWFVSYQVKLGANRNAVLGLLRAEMMRDGGPDPVFYKRIIHPGHEGVKNVIRAIRPDIDDERILEILAFNLIFQIIMLRNARGVTLKRLRKRTLTQSDADQIAHLISETTLFGLRDLKLQAE
ncbi:MAG: TetR/AcrR family transcriptional regulator [Pseudomonadota bacterium]